jgi:hypothetical protein
MARDDVIVTATLDLRMDGTTDPSVQVWSIHRQAPESEFDTVLDFGGRRLALCAASERMVVVLGRGSVTGSVATMPVPGIGSGSART